MFDTLILTGGFRGAIITSGRTAPVLFLAFFLILQEEQSAGEWIRQWRAKNLEKQLPEGSRVQK